jgi:type IV pilus assembly protein PilB
LDPDQPKLGEVLVAAGVISQLELLEALELQKADPRKPRLGQLLIEKGWASEGEICRALSGQLRLPFVDLRGMTLDPSVVATIPTDLATKHHCIAVGMRGDELLVAMADPTNVLAVDDLKTATKKKIKRVVAQPSLIARAIHSYYAVDQTAYWAQIATGRPPARVTDLSGGTRRTGLGRTASDMPPLDPTMRRFQEAARRSQPVSGEVVDVAKELLKPASPEVLEYTRRRVTDDDTQAPPAAREVEDLPPLPQVPPTAEAFRQEAQRAVEAMIADALRQKATEIRGEPGLEGYSIQFKSGGTYREVMGIPKRLQAATTALLKQIAGLDTSQHKIEQEGEFKLEADNFELAGTIKFTPSLNGEKFVIKSKGILKEKLTVDDLGLSTDDTKLMKAALGLPRGAIIVACPPGSGKTTTLLAMLDFLSQKHRNIQYVGSAPEQRPEGVDITEVDPSAGLTYPEALRIALRENPKVVFIDDLPDADMAEQALIAAMSGRLVVAGMVADDAPSAVTGLVEMGVDATKAGSAIALVVSQRVVKRICDRCRSEYDPPPKVLKALGVDSANARWQRGKGCEACSYTGYFGTAAFFQLMPITDLMKDQMKVQVTTTALMHAAASIGVPTLREAGLALAKDGITTVEEIARVLEVVEEKTTPCPGCGAQVKAEYVVCPYCSHSLSAGSCSNCGEEMKDEWVACPFCGTKRETAVARAVPRARSSFRGIGGEVSAIYDSGPVPGVQAAISPILVVEPDDKLRHHLEDLLARSGFYVLGASEPEQALRLTVGHKPSLVVLAESGEAGFDGVELAQRIRRTAQGSAVPIVFMSESGGVIPGGSDGENDVIARPAVDSEILSIVRRHLGGAQG